MEQKELMQAVQELIDAKTPEEITKVLQRNPELLNKENIEQIQEIAITASLSSDWQAASTLENVAEMLDGLVQRISEAGKVTNTVHQQVNQTTVLWARLTREYLALRKKEQLEQAIVNAEQAGENEIASLLRAMQENNIQNIEEHAPSLHQKLLSAGRSEEAWTVALLHLDMRASLAEYFIQFPLKQQAQALDIGIQACQQAAAITDVLGDQACKAFYLVAAGNGCYRGRRLEAAEKAYQEALTLRRKLAEERPDVYERDVAMTLNNLGNVLSDLRRLEAAEKAYQEALTLYRSRDIPDQMAVTLSGLSLLWMGSKRWEESAGLLEEAKEKVERLRVETLSLDRRMQIFRENIRIYENLLVCLMKLGRTKNALVVAEAGKSRTLVDLLALRDLIPRNVPGELADEYRRTVIHARVLEPKGGAETSRTELVKTHSRLQELIEAIRKHNPDFLPHAQPLSLQEICELAKEAQSTLVLLRVTQQGSFVFLVFPDSNTDSIEVPEFTAKTLNELLVKFEGEKAADGWLARYYAYRAAEGNEQKGKTQKAWLDTVDATLGKLYELLLKHVHQRLKGKTTSLVLVPNHGLAILPLHACWWKENETRRYLLDEFVIRYAPSLSVFKRCLERERTGCSSEMLLGAANPYPPGNLVFSEWECKEIERMLGSEHCSILWKEQATKKELMQRASARSWQWLHFSCHGQYRLDKPLESAVYLAGGEALTLGEIFEGMYLPEAWLVTLSACETGLVDFRDIADEHYGLPAGFLYAGAATVYSSLWMVNDLSTALLMRRVYEMLKDKKNKLDALTKVHALNEAQRWLRDITAGELAEILSKAELELGRPQQGLDRMTWTQIAPFRRDMEFGHKPDDRPFKHPYWWAGFQNVGV